MAISEWPPMNRGPTKFGQWMFFDHAPPIHGIQTAEMQEKIFCDVITSVLYCHDCGGYADTRPTRSIHALI